MDMRTNEAATAQGLGGVESSYAWVRLAASVALSTIGCIGMWSFVVALPTVQAELGLVRADASLPFTCVMVGFGIGGMLVGRVVDRFGILLPIMATTIALGLGYFAAAYTTNLWQLALAHALIGIGSSGAFGPLLTDISHWFDRRRGVAVAICSCGNYIGGAIWPPVIQHFITTSGWRPTHVAIGAMCIIGMLPLALVLARRAPTGQHHADSAAASAAQDAVGLSPGALTVLISIAGLACCAAMAMPQVHIVAYCSDLGYGSEAGAQMLSLMLGLGLISRFASGFVADRIGGLAAMLLSSSLQASALLLYLGFTSLTSLYLISALFGLFQGGLVPTYAIIVREYFPPREAGARLGIILMGTIIGMAFGGWMSGAIFDYTGSYHAAFANGFLWNLLNIAIGLWIILRRERRAALA